MSDKAMLVLGEAPESDDEDYQQEVKSAILQSIQSKMCIISNKYILYIYVYIVLLE